MKYTVQMHATNCGTQGVDNYTLKIRPQEDYFMAYPFKAFNVNCKTLGNNYYIYKIECLDGFQSKQEQILTLSMHDFDNVGCMRLFMNKILTNDICFSLWRLGTIPTPECTIDQPIGYTVGDTESIYNTIEQIEVAQ